MQTTNPRDYIELLQGFKIALSNGVIERQEIVEWADEIIKKDSEPDYFIIDLSLCGHQSINDVISLINEYIGSNEPQISSRVMFGFIYHRYMDQQLSLEKVMATVYWMIHNTKLTKIEKYFISRLNDAYYYAKAGDYRTVEAVEKQILQFFEIYKEFHINNFNEWIEIDKTIDEKVQHLPPVF